MSRRRPRITIQDLIDEGFAIRLVPMESNSTVDDRLRRLDLRCPHCPPNRKENAKRKARPDRYKTKRKK